MEAREGTLVKAAQDCRLAGMTAHEAGRAFKRQLLVESLLANNINQCRVARELSVHRNTVSRDCATLHINLAELKVVVSRKRPPHKVGTAERTAALA